MSLKGEALYASFNEDTTTGFSTAATRNMRWDNLDSYWVGRVGVNYHFNM